MDAFVPRMGTSGENLCNPHSIKSVLNYSTNALCRRANGTYKGVTQQELNSSIAAKFNKKYSAFFLATTRTINKKVYYACPQNKPVFLNKPLLF